jgi:signal peptidase II
MKRSPLSLKAIPTKMLLFLITLPLILVFDQWTKRLMVQHFYLGESIEIIPSIMNITYVQNKGAAFGMLSGLNASIRDPFFLVVPIVALLVIFAWFRQLPAKSRWLALALSLIVSGAIGNFIDRLHYGFVVDFLDFHWHYQAHFPAFNIADSAICVGVAMILLENLTKGAAEHASDTR